jgi:hypothetical protein
MIKSIHTLKNLLVSRTIEVRTKARVAKIAAIQVELPHLLIDISSAKASPYDTSKVAADMLELALDLLLTNTAYDLDVMVSNLTTKLSATLPNIVPNAAAAAVDIKDILKSSGAGATAKAKLIADLAQKKIDAAMTAWPFAKPTVPADTVDTTRAAKNAMKDAIFNGLRTNSSTPVAPTLSTVKGVPPRKVNGKPAVWANVRKGAGITTGKRRITGMATDYSGFTQVGIGKDAACGWKVKTGVTEAPFLTFIIGSENGVKVSFDEALTYWNLSLNAK